MGAENGDDLWGRGGGVQEWQALGVLGLAPCGEHPKLVRYWLEQMVCFPGWFSREPITTDKVFPGGLGSKLMMQGLLRLSAWPLVLASRRKRFGVAKVSPKPVVWWLARGGSESHYMSLLVAPLHQETTNVGLLLASSRAAVSLFGPLGKKSPIFRQEWQVFVGMEDGTIACWANSSALPLAGLTTTSMHQRPGGGWRVWLARA